MTQLDATKLRREIHYLQRKANADELMALRFTNMIQLNLQSLINVGRSRRKGTISKLYGNVMRGFNGLIIELRRDRRLARRVQAIMRKKRDPLTAEENELLLWASARMQRAKELKKNFIDENYAFVLEHLNQWIRIPLIRAYRLSQRIDEQEIAEEH